jgi:hypothetical protein
VVLCAAYDNSLDSQAIGYIYGEVLRATPLHHTRITYAVFCRVCKRLRLFEHDFTRSSALTPEVLTRPLTTCRVACILLSLSPLFNVTYCVCMYVCM